MTNIYSFPGLLTVIILFICSTAFIRTTPMLKRIFLSERHGFWGTFYKASVIGRRLHWLVSLLCFTMAFYLLFVK